MARIFVVVAETRMRELLYDALARQGHDVLSVSSGKQALETLKTQRPNYLIIDAAMPVLSGVQTIKHIREIDDTVSTVLLRGQETAPADELSEDARKELGIVSVVSKELSASLFLSAIELAIKQAGSATPSAQSPKLGGMGTILAVDDDPAMLRMLQLALTQRGVKIITANSGEEALKLLNKNPDMVLLDVNMPGMDGLLTLKKIRAARPNLPVIMASGVGEEAVAREALKLGAYDWVSKPFNIEYLQTMVLTKILLGMEQ